MKPSTDVREHCWALFCDKGRAGFYHTAAYTRRRDAVTAETRVRSTVDRRIVLTEGQSTPAIVAYDFV